MLFLYDNITATLLAGTVLLLLLSMQLRVARHSIQHTATYMTKKHSLTFADWLEDDLLSIGENMNPGSDDYRDRGGAIINLVNDSEGRTTLFEFRRDSVQVKSNGKADTLRVKVKYVLEPTDTREVEGETVELFQAVRSVKEWYPKTDPEPNYTTTGRSAGLLQHFEIEMRDRNGERIPNPDDVDEEDPGRIQQTHVRFAMASPFGAENSAMNTMHWGASLLLRR